MPRPIFEYGEDAVMGQTIFLAIADQGLPIKVRHTTQGAEPHAAITSPDNGPHVVARQAVIGGDGGETLTVLADPTETAEPEISCAVFEDVGNLIVDETVGGGERLEAGAIITTDATHRGRPDAAVAPLCQAADHIMAQAVALAESTPDVTLAQHEPVAGGQPHAALTVWQNRFDFGKGDAVGLIPLLEVTIL